MRTTGNPMLNSSKNGPIPQAEGAVSFTLEQLYRRGRAALAALPGAGDNSPMEAAFLFRHIFGAVSAGAGARLTRAGGGLFCANPAPAGGGASPVPFGGVGILRAGFFCGTGGADSPAGDGAAGGGRPGIGGGQPDHCGKAAGDQQDHPLAAFEPDLTGLWRKSAGRSGVSSPCSSFFQQIFSFVRIISTGKQRSNTIYRSP